MKYESLDEGLITAWVRLTSTLKNSRITKGMNYNESIVMLFAYHRYLEDGEGLVAFAEIVQETKMLKSLVNRTIDNLVKKGMLEKLDGTDKRTVFIRPVKGNLDEYLQVHAQSLQLARAMRDAIGEEDARTLIRISERISEIDPLSVKE